MNNELHVAVIQPITGTTEVQTLWLMDLWLAGHKVKAANLYSEYLGKTDGRTTTFGDYITLNNYFNSL